MPDMQNVYDWSHEFRKERKRRFFSQPCKPECLLHHNLGRFHFTCLTCWERRYKYKKFGWRKFTVYKKVMLVLESASGKGFAFPKHYKIYGLIIPLRDNGDGEMKCGKLRTYLLKALLTIAERIAEV